VTVPTTIANLEGAGKKSNKPISSSPLATSTYIPGASGSVTATADEDTFNWASDNPFDYAQTKDLLTSAYGIESDLADNIAQDLAQDFFDTFGHWPSYAELAAWEKTQARGTYYGNQFYRLPPMFGVDNEDGTYNWFANADGELTEITVTDPAFRPQFGGSTAAVGGTTSILTRGEIAAVLGAGRRGRGGGGGGGGGGRGPVFDRAQLRDAATEIWRALLIEEPDNLDSLVDSFISSATSFARQGGVLNFETFIRNAALATPRAKMIYARKPESVAHESYLAAYATAVRNLGLRESRTADLAVAGAAAGSGSGAFQEQITRLTEFQAANQGQFSQRFANTIRQLGVLGT
jgi:hypothetical protein